MKINDILGKFLVWRIRNVSTRNFVILLSVLIGCISGLAAVILKTTVYIIQEFLTGGRYHEYFFLIYPLAGIVLTIIISRYFLREKMGHGITDIIFSISRKSSQVEGSKTYSRMVTSSVTVGFGGSVGLEAPIVVTGSAIGSNVAQFLHLDYANRTVLVACGAAASISAIFNSPIAGVLFCFEVLMTDMPIIGFIPLLIASVSGSLVSLALLGDDILFAFHLNESLRTTDIPYYIILAIITGMVSLYFTRMNYWIERKIRRFRNFLVRGIVGGILLGLIIYFFPSIYGEGYDTIKAVLNGQEFRMMNTMGFIMPENSLFPILFLTGIILIKPIATSLTISAGGSGGIFAPSLFLGGITGLLFSTAVNAITGGALLNPAIFTLIGMCGVMSGVLHAPLTAIFLIAEITSGYMLIVPLMIASAISFYTIIYFERFSIYTKKLYESGDYDPYDRDKQVLTILNLNKLIETDLLPVKPDHKLRELIGQIRKSSRNIFPVVNENQELAGIITLDDIREIMFDEEAWDKTIVRNLMHTPPDIVDAHDDMKKVMKKFESTGAWNLPVIQDGKYIGFVSKSSIFSAYRVNLRRKFFG
ncbi:MAG TPA: chloride channel protein [Cyclobacteriaceae bacterium]|nr:chloride channel protein [Cyclobacteriaceae bacterium]